MPVHHLKIQSKPSFTPRKVSPTVINCAKLAISNYYESISLYTTGEIPEALSIGSQAAVQIKIHAKHSPYLHKCYVHLGKIHLALGNIEDGLSYFEACRQLPHIPLLNQAELDKAYALIMIKFGNEKMALNLLIKVLKGLKLADPSSRSLYLELSLLIADLHGSLSKPKKQLNLILKVQQLQPFYQIPFINILILNSLANYYNQNKHYNAALRALLQAKKESENAGFKLLSKELGSAIGEIFIKTKRLKEAENMLELVNHYTLPSAHYLRQKISYQLVQVYSLLGKQDKQFKLEKELRV